MNHRDPRRRLWAYAIALASIIATIAGAAAFHCPADGRMTFGYDLLPSYVAGQLLREGRPGALYDPRAVRDMERRVARDARLDVDVRSAPWLNPPFYAWLFEPLSALPYRAAAWVWLGASVAMLAGACALMMQMLRAGGWKTWGIVPLGLLACVPAWEAAWSLQNTFLSLLILTSAVGLARRGRALAAGLVAGLLLYKPQLGIVVAAALAATMGRRAVVGLVATTAALLSACALALPGTLSAFWSSVPRIVAELQGRPGYNWTRQATLQGFFRLLLQGESSGPTGTPAKIAWAGAEIALVAGLLLAARRRRSKTALLGSCIVAMPLLMPYYMEYDLLLLAPAAVLFACEWGKNRGAIDRWLAGAWALAPAAVAVNPIIAGITRLNLSVGAIAALAGLSIARMMRPGDDAGTMGDGVAALGTLAGIERSRGERAAVHPGRSGNEAQFLAMARRRAADRRGRLGGAEISDAGAVFAGAHADDSRGDAANEA